LVAVAAVFNLALLQAVGQVVAVKVSMVLAVQVQQIKVLLVVMGQVQ
jgi:hypothetical protein